MVQMDLDASILVCLQIKTSHIKTLIRLLRHNYMHRLHHLMYDENHSPHVVLLDAGASLASFKEGDAYKRILPLMNNFVEVVGLNKLLEKNEINYNNQNFEEIYNDLSENEKYNALVRSIEEKTFEYFSQLKIPSTPTIYDYLVLSLREKDIIATFNWDPLLLQAYARNSGVKRLPRLEFLHGNVGMGVCVKDKVMGHIWNRCSKCKEFLKPVKLLYH